MSWKCLFPMLALTGCVGELSSPGPANAPATTEAAAQPAALELRRLTRVELDNTLLTALKALGSTQTTFGEVSGEIAGLR